jgi:hypothetical protein
MYEEEAEEYVPNINWHAYSSKEIREEMMVCYRKGAEFGYQKAMKEWRDCFMLCSSPYCADKFRDIQCGGMLGNMTKEVRDGSVE